MTTPPKQRKVSLFAIIVTLILVAGCAGDTSFRTRAHDQNRDIANIEDIKAEIEFGQNIAARILGRYPLVGDAKLNEYVNLVGTGLATHAGRPEIKFYFAVIDADELNAYSTPGGYVFITKGAIRAMRDESELAGVLAHEIAHITQKHIVNEFKIRGKDDSTVSGITRIVGQTGDSARLAFFQAVDKATEMLLETGFKHEDEHDSDQVATLLLAQTGYDPAALSRYLNRVRKLSKENANKESKTHPATNERLTALSNLIKAEGLDKTGMPQGKKRFSHYAKVD